MFRYGCFALSLCLLITAAFAQTDQRALLQQDLASQFKLTRMTADRTDIVRAGSVLELQKDGLLMTSVDTVAPPTSTYKNGKVGMNFGAQLSWNMQLGGTNSDAVPKRTFVAGEKFWITAFNVEDDGVVFTFFSDPYNDVRYYGKLKVPYPNKHAIPPADEMMKTIAQVIAVQADDNAATQPTSAPAPAQSPQQAMKPIAPPPPPADEPPAQPKTISLGMTKEQVNAILGQPQKVVNLATKEIDYYPDMKVIFVHNKVTDVQ